MNREFILAKSSLHDQINIVFSETKRVLGYVQGAVATLLPSSLNLDGERLKNYAMLLLELKPLYFTTPSFETVFPEVEKMFRSPFPIDSALVKKEDRELLLDSLETLIELAEDYLRLLG